MLPTPHACMELVRPTTKQGTISWSVPLSHQDKELEVEDVGAERGSE